MGNKRIVEGVTSYYNKKLMEYGATPQGVDWNSKESQFTRFEQLSKVINSDLPFSILDYGCGFGNYVEYLNNHYSSKPYNYIGYDASESMLAEARKLYPPNEYINFVNQLDVSYDYLIASGLFNVKLDIVDEAAWKEYIFEHLELFNKLAAKGFAYNLLTSYSDKEYMKDYLHYANPSEHFDYCKRHFSRNVALLHDYNLYEFTIIVRK